MVARVGAEAAVVAAVVVEPVGGGGGTRWKANAHMPRLIEALSSAWRSPCGTRSLPIAVSSSAQREEGVLAEGD